MPISSAYNNGYGLNISSLYQQAMNEGSAAGNSANAGGIGGSGAGLFTSLMSSYKGQMALSNALAEIKQEVGSERITFKDIEAYRKKMEEEFSAQVKKDLLERGIDPEVDFTLITDSTGKLTVVSKHEDKAKIQQYFDENPEMAEKFETIQTLGNFKKTTESPQVRDWDTMRELKKGLQAQAVELFFQSAQEAGVGFSNMYANFSGGGTDDATSYMLGLNQTV